MLTVLERLTQEQRARRVDAKRSAIADVVGENVSTPMVTPNKGGVRIYCKLCRQRGIKMRSSFGCTTCLEGFHVDCFLHYHYRAGFHATRKTVRLALQ